MHDDPDATGAANRVRVGVLCDSLTPPGWVADILTRIARRDDCEIVLFVRNADSASFSERLRRRPLTAIVFALLNRLESKLSRLISAAADADRPTERDADLCAVPVIDVQPEVSPSGLVHRFSPEDCERVRAARCDVLLRFGFAILKGELLECANHGIWSFHHGDNQVNRGGPPGFWEWFQGTAETGTILQVLTEELDAGSVINRAWYRTCLLSWNENRRRIFVRSRELLLDSLGRLAADGRVAALERPPVYSQPLLLAPSLARSGLALLKLAARFLKAAGRRLLLRETWELAVGDLSNGRAELRRFTPLVPPRGLFWADPFLLRRDGAEHIFAEEFDFATGVGRVVCLTLDGNRVAARRVVMDTGAHFSYPYVFEHDGELYFCPQDTGADGIELHRCAGFPDQWESCGLLVPGVQATDTSIHRLEDRWWMFTNICRNPLDDYGYELHLYWADDPVRGPWHPHTGNPVSQDARFARNGGGLVTLAGGQYRVAQGLTSVYGGKSQLMRVHRLDTQGYEESLCQEITPDWAPGLDGTHHFHGLGDRAVVDALRFRWRWR